MEKSNFEKGREGEAKARGFLKERGYEILENNWHFHRYEIDIIAKRGEELVIVEVKTRASDFFGDPEDAVDVGKRRRIAEAADAYIEINDLDIDVRFDIIAILKLEGELKIRHIEDAFETYEL